MAGVIGIRDPSLAERVFFIVNATGAGLAPFECFLLMRGVKTLPLRMDKQQSNAIAICNHLEATYGFRILYPGSKSHPQRELHASQASGPGAVLAFTTGDVELSKRITEAVVLFAISVSFGCVNSLISMPGKRPRLTRFRVGYMSHASIPKEVRDAREFPEDLVRLCIGIEDADDLIQDLDTAIKKSLQYPKNV